MSMKPQEISPVPEETARVARAANPKGNIICGCVMSWAASTRIRCLRPCFLDEGNQRRPLGVSR